MKPLLAHTYEPHRWDGASPCWVQPKLNGVRALYQAGCFQSRDELPWPKDMLKHLSEPLLAMFDERVILDGELYVHGWPLQRINQAVAVNATVRGATEDTAKIEYHIFDVVNFNKTFYERFQPVQHRIKMLQHPFINAVTTVEAPSIEWVDEFYSKFVAEGFEGIMYRLGACPYTNPKQPANLTPLQLRFKTQSKYLSDKNNRVWHLLKRKDWQDEEFTCLGVEEGLGKRSEMVGAFICARYIHDIEPTKFRVGSGLTDIEATHYFHNPPIGRKIKVKFLCYTRDGIPFNPTVEAIL